jgi:hypothetical protein
MLLQDDPNYRGGAARPRGEEIMTVYTCNDHKNAAVCFIGAEGCPLCAAIEYHEVEAQRIDDLEGKIADLQDEIATLKDEE